MFHEVWAEQLVIYLLSQIQLIKPKNSWFFSDLISAISLATTVSDSFRNPFDYCSVSMDIIAVTYVSPDQNSLHLISIKTREVCDSLTAEIAPFAVCMMDTLVVSDKLSRIIYTHDWSSKQLKLLVRKIRESGFMDRPSAACTITFPVNVASWTSTLYVTESPVEYEGSIRVFSNLERLVTFKSFCCGIVQYFGMVSKREKNYMLKRDPPLDVPTSLNMIDIARKLHKHSNKLVNLIEKMRQIDSNENLDIAHGLMALQTAGAVYLTLKNGISFLNSYFTCIGETDLLTKMSPKVVTNKLLEFFFGNLTQGVIDELLMMPSHSFCHMLNVLTAVSLCVQRRRELWRRINTV